MTDVRWWTRAKRVMRAEELPGDPSDPQPFTRTEHPSALRIAQGCAYDPGSAVYRFHSAVNEATPHASLFVRIGDSNPYTSYRQIDHWREYDVLKAAIRECDVAHCHVDYVMIDLANEKMRPGAVLVRNYHGSVVPNPLHSAELHEQAKRQLFQIQRDLELGAIVVGARLDHLQVSPDVSWVPMTQPVHRYAALRERLKPPVWFGRRRPMRIGHSPTAPKIKGTADLVAAVEILQRKGRLVELCLIEKMSHRVALERKATCDVFFDSFFLGIQGSGLEAGAMGIPVVAGDPNLRQLHFDHIGECPYAYANTRDELVATLDHMFEPEFYAHHAAHVREYVWAYHSYAAVADRYLRVLQAKAPHLAPRIAASLDVEPDEPDSDAVTERPARKTPAPETPAREPVRKPARRTPIRPGREPVAVPQREPAVVT